jgi:hypothetical protein
MALINTTTTGILGTTVYGDGAGELTVQQNGVTINKVTKNPTFYAYPSVSMTISTGTWTKVAMQSEVFDTDSCYDTSNYRFLPTTPGYYLLTLTLTGTSSTPSITRFIGSIAYNGDYGNGRVWDMTVTTSGNWIQSGSFIRYFDGSTTYADPYTYMTGSGTLTIDFTQSKFTGTLVRAA